MKLNPLWLLWFIFALAITVGPFATLAQVFHTHSPAPVAAALPAVPVLLALGVFLFHRFRLPRWEPILLVSLPLVLCLAKAPLPTLLAIALFASAHAIGARLLPEPPESPILRIALRFGIGIGVVMAVCFLSGLAGLFRWPVTVLLLAPAVFSMELFADLRQLRQTWVEIDDLRHPAVSTLLFFALLLGAIGALWTLTPEIAFDPLKMHLVSARWYAQTGTFTPVPTLPESYYPQGTELLMALLWMAGGQAAAQVLAPVFFFATLLITIAVLRACGLTRIASVCGIIAAVSLPFLHWTAFVAKNDFPLAFFLLASLACLLNRRPLLATVFLSLAFGIKHVALFGAVGLTPLFLREIWFSPKRVRTFFAVAGIFLVLGTASLVRTYVLTGNPLYPESTARTADFSVLNHPTHTTYDRVMRYAGIPWLLHFDGQRAFESSSPNPMGFWLVFFVLAWLAWIPDRTLALRLSLLFCGIYLLYWVSILVTLRYAIAPILLLTALTAPALFRMPKWLATAAVFYCIFFSLAVITLIEISPPQLLWWAGQIDTGQFLSQQLPTYPVTQALQGLVQPADQILELGGCSGPYAPYAGAIHCYMPVDMPNPAVALPSAVASGKYRFLILPTGQLPPAIQAVEKYRDSQFALYELNPRAAR